MILVFTMCIHVLLLYASKITHTYFYFFIWARLCLFLSSLGSSVIGLPFPPLGCLSVIFFVNVTCADFVTNHVVGDIVLSFIVGFRDGRT